MMHPQAEAEESRRHQRDHDQPIPNEGSPGHRRHDHGDHAGSRQKDDVDFRVTEKPEEMLPQKRISAPGWDEERPVECAFEFQHHRRENDRGESEHDHGGEDQHRPREDRHLVERHARRAIAQHAHDDLDCARYRRNLDETDAQKPEIGAQTRRKLRTRERRVHEPSARRRCVEKDRGKEDKAADCIGPERKGAKARKRKISRAEHLRKEQNAHRLDGRNREEKHHHRAVHREQLVVSMLIDELTARRRQLRAHDKRKNSGKNKKQEGCTDV